MSSGLLERRRRARLVRLAAFRPRRRAAAIERHLAIVDALLVARLVAQPLLQRLVGLRRLGGTLSRRLGVIPGMSADNAQHQAIAAAAATRRMSRGILASPM